MPESRTMIHFADGDRVFNVRAAAIILRDGHILVCREDDDDFMMLPGGRVERGEGSAVALAREIEEELQCVGEIGPLLFTAENFFHLTGEEFHQIGFYYQVTLPDDFPFRTDGTCLTTRDEGHDLRFDWVKATPEILSQWNLFPKWLCGRVHALPETTQHLILDER